MHSHPQLRRRLLLVGAVLAIAAALPLTASPASGGRQREVVKSFPFTNSVRISLTYRRIRPGRGVLVRLAANGLSIYDDGHGRIRLSRHGRSVRLVRVSRRRHSLTHLRLRFNSSSNALGARAGRSRRSRRLALRPENRVRVGSRKRGPYRLGKVRISPGRPIPGYRSPRPGEARPFSPSSFWNKPLAAKAPLDPLSSTWAADLKKQMIDANPWINTTKYSTPVYIVPRHQPTVRVKLDTAGNADLQRAWDAVPLPPGARPASGSDKHLTVWQPSTDTLWDFWVLEKHTDGWHASWGGRMRHVSTNPGYFNHPSFWGATATSLPLLGGLMRISELRAGHIDHGLALAIPKTRAAWFSWPAQRTDGWIKQATAIPEGARFRIDPRLDLSKLKMAPIVRMMAVAVQRYGMVIRDKGGAVAFFGEDPTPTGTNPYSGPHGFYGGKFINQLLEDQFPWNHLQALKASQRCCWRVD